MARRLKLSWWDRFVLLPWRIVGDVESADDIPSELPRHGAVVVGAGNKLKWIAFDCPCQLRHRIMLNLDASRYPYWRVRRGKKDRLTISPSVSSLENNVHCHYFIREGKVIWTRD
jgi:hypothetical protein